MIVFEPPPAVAALAGFELPFAPPPGAAPHLPLHLGGDRIAAGAWTALARLLDETLALGVLGEDEVEAALEDLLCVASRAGMPERILRGLELLEEAAGDGDVQARELGVEPLHGLARRWRTWLEPRGVRHGGKRFIQVNYGRPRCHRLNSQCR